MLERRAPGVLVLGGGLAALVLVVAAVNVFVEPYFAVSLIGVATMLPWDYGDWRLLLDRTILIASDLLLLPLAGLVLWLGERPRALRPAALTVVLLSSALVLSGKVGADMNYYLCLRIPAAFAIGAVWRTLHAPANRSIPQMIALTVIVAVAILGLTGAIASAANRFHKSRGFANFFTTPTGQRVLRSYREADALAENPNVHILTDSGLIDICQGDRAAYGDPWLLRKLIEAGKIRPTRITEWIDSQHYEMIITAHDIDSPRYLKQDFRFPDAILEHIHAHYVFREWRPGLCYYGRRGRPWPPPGLSIR